MLPEALPTLRDRLPDNSRPRRAPDIDAPRPPLPEPAHWSDVDAFAVEWQVVAGGEPDQ